MALCYLLKRSPSKAKTDVDEIMRGVGFRNVGLSQPPHIGKFRDFFTTLFGVVKAGFSLKRGDVLVLQYNLRKYYGFMCRTAHRRGAKVVTLIHDLGSFYRSKLSHEDEIARIGQSDYLIVHNDRMKQWLTDHGCRVPMGTLEIFDYLSSTEPAPVSEPRKPYGVIYAGTLSKKKNGFLYDLEDHINNYRFILYGGGFDPEAIRRRECFEYHGFVSSDKLVESPGGEFGLVWDGSSIHACEGPRGEYTRYNNPHKFSLYLRCGIPVIIWKQAAMAKFIDDHGVGICVESLTELDRVLGEITPGQYASMQRAARRIGEKLGRGFYFKRALREALVALGAQKEINW
ncbi:MAG: galactofuranosyltransferase [Rikenellaceae bacterium]|nr:galactofuranosyltransferase [Rikenellaceae bacterium]